MLASMLISLKNFPNSKGDISSCINSPNAGPTPPSKKFICPPYRKHSLIIDSITLNFRCEMFATLKIALNVFLGGYFMTGVINSNSNYNSSLLGKSRSAESAWISFTPDHT